MDIKFSVPKQRQPDVDNGVKVIYASDKRKVFKLRWYAILLVVISPVVFMLYQLANDTIIVKAKGLLNTDAAILYTSDRAKIEQILVQPGQQVVAGQALMQLSSESLTGQQALLATELASLHNRQQNRNSVLLRSLEKALAAAQEGLADQRATLAKYNALRREGVLSEAEMAEIRNQYTQAKILVHDRQYALDNAKREFYNESITGPVASLMRDLSQQSNLLQLQQNALNLVASRSGTVHHVFVKEGDIVTNTTPLVLLSQIENQQVISYLPPKFLDYSHIGQHVTIILPNGQTVAGQVSAPTVMAAMIPDSLSTAFQRDNAALEVTIKPERLIDAQIENLPVTVRFHFQGAEQGEWLERVNNWWQRWLNLLWS
ncbi:HlyD family secretion protein [Motilimonas sp. KMU-193]|uniref:HlyD family secretion protein n=1 Tax=Motilimonas sp. KMU-193 TaxID=3388668 RepID=UPI00396B1AD9